MSGPLKVIYIYKNRHISLKRIDFNRYNLEYHPRIDLLSRKE